jgi:hypothetical protein
VGRGAERRGQAMHSKADEAENSMGQGKEKHGRNGMSWKEGYGEARLAGLARRCLVR